MKKKFLLLTHYYLTPPDIQASKTLAKNLPKSSKIFDQEQPWATKHHHLDLIVSVAPKKYVIDVILTFY